VTIPSERAPCARVCIQGDDPRGTRARYQLALFITSFCHANWFALVHLDSLICSERLANSERARIRVQDRTEAEWLAELSMRMRAEKNRQICIDNRLRAVRVVHPGRDGIIFSLNKSINIPAERINIRTIRTERFGQQRHDVRASLIIRPKERSGESSRHARERNQSTQKGSSVAGTSSKRPARLRDFSRRAIVAHCGAIARWLRATSRARLPGWLAQTRAECWG